MRFGCKLRWYVHATIEFPMFTICLYSCLTTYRSSYQYLSFIQIFLLADNIMSHIHVSFASISQQNINKAQEKYLKFYLWLCSIIGGNPNEISWDRSFVHIKSLYLNEHSSLNYRKHFFFYHTVCNASSSEIFGGSEDHTKNETDLILRSSSVLPDF